MEVGTFPEGFEAYNSWAGSLHVVHMAYAAFALVGVAVLASDDLPVWLGWLGVGWRTIFFLDFVMTRFAGFFNPPWWAHAYTGILGAVLLASL